MKRRVHSSPFNEMRQHIAVECNILVSKQGEATIVRQYFEKSDQHHTVVTIGYVPVAY